MMNRNVFVAVAFASIISMSAAFAGATAQDKTDAQSINTACAQDAQTAGCSGEVVGKGLLRCLHKYKHDQRATNKSFDFSPSCSAAMKQLHADKKAGK